MRPLPYPKITSTASTALVTPLGSLFSEEALAGAWEPSVVTQEYITSIGVRVIISITSTLVIRKQSNPTNCITRNQLALVPTSNTVDAECANTFGMHLNRTVGAAPQTKTITLCLVAKPKARRNSPSSTNVCRRG